MGLFGFNWGLPDDISVYGTGIDSLMIVLHWFMLILFLGWGTFMTWCLVKFRARAGHTATYEPIHAKASKWLEIGIAIFEGVLLLFFSMPVWAHFKNDIPAENDPDAIHVRIVAQQFAWNFHYAGSDGQFGKTDGSFVSDDNPVGIDPDDPNGKDDIVTVNQLHFPIDVPVEAKITSKDVIHSFGVPILRIKQDAIPGMLIPIWFEAKGDQVEVAKKHAQEKIDDLKKRNPNPSPADQSLIAMYTDETTGAFDIACSQLCGIGHGRMRAILHADTPEQYAQWLKENAPEPPAPANTPAPAPTSTANPK